MTGCCADESKRKMRALRARAGPSLAGREQPGQPSWPIMATSCVDGVDVHTDGNSLESRPVYFSFSCVCYDSLGLDETPSGLISVRLAGQLGNNSLTYYWKLETTSHGIFDIFENG